MIRRMVGMGLLVVMVAVTAGACATMKDEPKASTAPSLYKRLGGREGIAQIVDAFYANLAADPRTAGRFKDMPAASAFKFRSNVSDMICDATGGPCSYTGRDMKATHTGMKISDAEWNATMENLGKALDARKVGEKEKQEVLAVVGPLKDQIVGQ